MCIQYFFEPEAFRAKKGWRNKKAEAPGRGLLFVLNAEREKNIVLISAPNSAYPKRFYNQLKLTHGCEQQHNNYTYTQQAHEYDRCSV